MSANRVEQMGWRDQVRRSSWCERVRLRSLPLDTIRLGYETRTEFCGDSLTRRHVISGDMRTLSAKTLNPVSISTWSQGTNRTTRHLRAMNSDSRRVTFSYFRSFPDEPDRSVLSPHRHPPLLRYQNAIRISPFVPTFPCTPVCSLFIYEDGTIPSDSIQTLMVHTLSYASNQLPFTASVLSPCKCFLTYHWRYRTLFLPLLSCRCALLNCFSKSNNSRYSDNEEVIDCIILISSSLLRSYLQPMPFSLVRSVNYA